MPRFWPAPPPPAGGFGGGWPRGRVQSPNWRSPLTFPPPPSPNICGCWREPGFWCRRGRSESPAVNWRSSPCMMQPGGLTAIAVSGKRVSIAWTTIYSNLKNRRENMATKNKPGVETAKGPLVLPRIFDAPRERVWKAWTEPREGMRWWGPKIFTSPSCKIDFRVGGKYLFCMRSDSGPEVWQKGLWSTGVYKEIVPMEKIVCTDCFADEQGNVVPASHYGFEEDFPLQMLVTIQFEKLEGNRTRMTLRHAGLPAGEHTKGANKGWNESFDKLAGSLNESNSETLVIERILN